MNHLAIVKLQNHDYMGAIELLEPNLMEIIGQEGGRQSDEYYEVLNLYLTLSIAMGNIGVKSLVNQEIPFNMEEEDIEILLFLKKCLMEIAFLENDTEAAQDHGDFLLDNLDAYFDAIEGIPEADDIMASYKMIMYTYAKFLLEEKNLEKSLDVLDLVISIEDPQDEFPEEFYLEKKATILSMLGRADEAIEFLDGSITNEDTDAIILLKKLSVLHLNQGNSDQAISLLKRCLHILTGFGEEDSAYVIYADLASVYHQIGNEEEALKAENKIIELDPPAIVSMSSEAFATAAVSWKDMDTFTVRVFARLTGIADGEFTYRLSAPSHIEANYKIHGTDEVLATNSFEYTPERLVAFESPSFADVEEGKWIMVQYDIYDSADKTNLLCSHYQLVKKALPEEDDFGSHGHSHGGHGHSHGEDDHGHSHSHGGHGHSHNH
eukprot:TRINITY_DN773_c0_g1_i2.p1 TRINITY_DN773_c0_g1~~TRINITY_DN773_c0_g1_i2.p1  ORF type:complete len:436 (+),score=119.17 TRINITY_DN773_c0_g1_i2:86-1393(+)